MKTAAQETLNAYIVRRAGELTHRNKWVTIAAEVEDLYGQSISSDAIRKRYHSSNEDQAPFNILSFCSKARTLDEIAKAASLETGEAQGLLCVYPGYELYTQRNNFGEVVYIYLPVYEEEFQTEERIWTHRSQPDGQPYLWVQFPEMPWPKLKIVPISDVHYGCNGHLNEKFREYVNWIAKTPNVFCFLNGDMVDNALDPGKGGFEQTSPSGFPQISEFMRLIAPIAHKILWAQPGNHEWRTARHTNIDPTWIICEKFGIPYFSEPCYIDILWQTYRFTFFTFHGTSNSQTKGGKMNAASRPTQWQDWTMFTISGHVHDKVAESELRMVRDVVNFRLEMKKYYIVVAGSFMGYFGTYASRAGYRPGAIGTVSCDLYPNGDYHASS